MTDLQKCNKYLKLYKKLKRNTITSEELEEFYQLMDDINNMQYEQEELDNFLEKADNIF